MTVAEAANLWGVHRSRVLIWIKEGRVPATLTQTPLGSFWIIPDDTPKPEAKPPWGHTRKK